jgi:hypothetical protein
MKKKAKEDNKSQASETTKKKQILYDIEPNTHMKFRKNWLMRMQLSRKG